MKRQDGVNRKVDRSSSLRSLETFPRLGQLSLSLYQKFILFIFFLFLISITCEDGWKWRLKERETFAMSCNSRLSLLCNDAGDERKTLAELAHTPSFSPPLPLHSAPVETAR